MIIACVLYKCIWLVELVYKNKKRSSLETQRKLSKIWNRTSLECLKKVLKMWPPVSFFLVTHNSIHLYGYRDFQFLLYFACFNGLRCRLTSPAKGDVRRTTKSADFCGHGLVARQNRWTMTHGRYFHLLLRTISASTTAECRSQNNTCITFFCI